MEIFKLWLLFSFSFLWSLCAIEKSHDNYMIMRGIWLYILQLKEDLKTWYRVSGNPM